MKCERCGEVNPAEIHTCTPQEPVAWFCELPDNKISIKIVGKPTEGNWKPLYTAPPQETQETISKWIKANTEHREWYICPKCNHQTPRFKDEWQGLTDDEIKEIVGPWGSLPIDGYTRKLFDQIEAKLKEKNT
jgi:hypothetical protein